MSYDALLNLVYQLSLIIAGLLIASLAMRFRFVAGQWFGGFVCAAAAVWAAWTAIDQYYSVAKPFAVKWLGLVQVLATIMAAILVFVVVILTTEKPEGGKEQSL
jgi:phage-related protein